MSEEEKRIVLSFGEKIKAELLARSISHVDNPEYTETVEIGEEEITIKLKR